MTVPIGLSKKCVIVNFILWIQIGVIMENCFDPQEINNQYLFANELNYFRLDNISLLFYSICRDRPLS